MSRKEKLDFGHFLFLKDTTSNCFSVIPAQAGIHTQFDISLANVMDSRLRGNDKMKKGQSPADTERNIKETFNSMIDFFVIDNLTTLSIAH